MLKIRHIAKPKNVSGKLPKPVRKTKHYFDNEKTKKNINKDSNFNHHIRVNLFINILDDQILVFGQL